MSDYSSLELENNPFPENPSVDIASDDKRINGMIFYEGIFPEELEKIRNRVNSRTNLVYIRGLQHTRGVGKTAILVHIWKELRQNPKIFSAFIKCLDSPPTNKPAGFCSAVVKHLHEQGYIWQAFWKMMTIFAEEKKSATFGRDDFQKLIDDHPLPTNEDIHLGWYTYVADRVKFARDVSQWLQEKYKMREFSSALLSECYFSSPNSILKKLSGKMTDSIGLYGDVLTLLRVGGFDYGYIFLDNFEDSVTAKSTRIEDLSIGMRRMVELSSGKASILVTLHPDSHMRLDAPESKSLQSIAPLDEKRVIPVNVLDVKTKLVVPLAVEYIRNYRRGSNVPYETFPLEPNVIRYVCYLKQGNLRSILQQLHECIEQAIQLNKKVIDMNLVKENHNLLMGKHLNEKNLQEFESFLRQE